MSSREITSIRKGGKPVAVIGAGVAGCAAAGALKDYGIDFVVFDANTRAGGLWADNYPEAKVQSTFELYEYPCKMFPPSIRNRKDPPAPTAEEVCIYLEEYITEKKMNENFVFRKKVKQVLCVAEDDWIVEFDGFTMQHFSFVIVCNGLVSSKPNKIVIPGMQRFVDNGGIILHSSERRSDDIFAKGKRVLVIGNGKSAVDAATAASDVAKKNAESTPAGTYQPPIQLARRQTWYVPRNLLGVVPYKYAFHTRAMSAFHPRYFETRSFILRILHFVLAPLKWIAWRLVELVFLLQYRLPYKLWPKLCTVESAALETSILITDECHLRRLRKREIDMRVGTVKRFDAGKAILNDGKEEDIDVVVLATGWKLAFDLFVDSAAIFSGLDFDKDALDFCSDGLWLYRNVLPAGFKGMAFVGSNTLTFQNILTAYIQAYWLAQLLAGERPWPTEEHMKETVAREKDFKRRYYPKCPMRGASIEAYMQHYHDVLFREMNARKPFNCLVRPMADLFVPVVPSLMKGCLEPCTSPEGPLPHESSPVDLHTHENDGGVPFGEVLA